MKQENDKQLIIFDRSQVVKLQKKAGKLVVQREAEAELLKLLYMQEFVDNLVEQVKEQIVRAGTKIDEGFKGIIGDRVKAIYRFYGSKYSYDKDKTENVKEFLNEVKYYRVNSDKVEEYKKEHGELPDGIEENDREKQLKLNIEE